jgi:hypothetical protein
MLFKTRKIVRCHFVARLMVDVCVEGGREKEYLSPLLP